MPSFSSSRTYTSRPVIITQLMLVISLYLEEWTCTTRTANLFHWKKNRSCHVRSRDDWDDVAQLTSDVKRRKLSGSYTKIKAYFFLGSARIFLGFGSTKKIRLDSAQLFCGSAFAAPASAYTSKLGCHEHDIHVSPCTSDL